MQQPPVQLPHTVYLEITNRCNSKCATCVRTYAMPEEERDLGLEEIRALVAGFGDTPPQRFVLNGIGEATLHADLVEIVAMLKQTRARVLFNTNAIALRPALALQLSRAGLDELRISCDGARRETYKLLRGVDSFHKVVDNVTAVARALKEAGAAQPALSIWITGTADNVEELPALVDLVHSMGVPELYYQRLVFRDDATAFGVANAGHAILKTSQGDLPARQRQAFAAAEDRARELGVKLRGSGNADAPSAVPRSGDSTGRPWQQCGRPFASTYVTANGNVLPCCISLFATSDYEAITLGNVFRSPLLKVWNDHRYEDFRNRFHSDNPVDCCRRCGTDWSL